MKTIYLDLNKLGFCRFNPRKLTWTSRLHVQKNQFFIKKPTTCHVKKYLITSWNLNLSSTFIITTWKTDSQVHITPKKWAFQQSISSSKLALNKVKSFLGYLQNFTISIWSHFFPSLTWNYLLDYRGKKVIPNSYKNPENRST